MEQTPNLGLDLPQILCQKKFLLILANTFCKKEPDCNKYEPGGSSLQTSGKQTQTSQ